MTESSQLTPSQAEKCPACGSPAVLYKIRLGLEEQPEVEAHARQLWLACMDCNHRWPAESDRVAYP
jgi:DNA-directed RNA polymerase subunit M/transcription elongation factor TFIIS